MFQIANREIGDHGSPVPQFHQRSGMAVIAGVCRAVGGCQLYRGSLVEFLFGVQFFDSRTYGETPDWGGELF